MKTAIRRAMRAVGWQRRRTPPTPRSAPTQDVIHHMCVLELANLAAQMGPVLPVVQPRSLANHGQQRTR